MASISGTSCKFIFLVKLPDFYCIVISLALYNIEKKPGYYTILQITT